MYRDQNKDELNQIENLLLQAFDDKKIKSFKLDWKNYYDKETGKYIIKPKIKIKKYE